ncbi:SMI1 / KNR4 family (SUKH-1) [Streptomyces sp. WMMB 714]|uniref:SMI1/KNR4 family protein n=1 Tax=Streptomyces sp. WMMB 714 TaxID=1286822 RepID=UPI0005F82663|nr:SMI1/KNR4 family protein [Streptomyces sp. WMMB 714]SCK51755.1 SMI1 / KNR4 family (SUKH-1) [Streptomyces sp. WMMB 714]
MDVDTWDAAEVRERLRALAEADAGCRRFAAGRHRYRLHPPVADTLVRRFEQDHGVELPDSYLSFITTVGSGGAGPGFGLLPFGSDEWARQQADLGDDWADLLSTPFPHTGRFQPWPIERACPRHAPDDEYFDPCWFTGSLVLADIGCGSYFRLVVTGPARGQVWSDDLACDEGLNPGPEFREWYMQWLAKPGATGSGPAA